MDGRLSSRSIPTGPGSRGGRWHDPAFRREYQRAWRATHPDYEERERLRMVRKRAAARGEDPGLITGPADTGRRPGSFPAPSCEGCGTPLLRPLCGFCALGIA